jgi:hypothetical protein
MRYRLKDVFAQFDEVCRSILKAADDETKLQGLAPQSLPDIDSGLGDRSNENSYASHVARGMAKVRSRR